MSFMFTVVPHCRLRCRRGAGAAGAAVGFVFVKRRQEAASVGGRNVLQLPGRELGRCLGRERDQRGLEILQ